MRDFDDDGIPINKKRGLTGIDWTKPDAKRKYAKMYRRENLEELKITHHEQYLKRAKDPKWVAEQLSQVKKKSLLTKKQVFMHYSRGVPQCACCGELMYEFLTIDHIEGKKKFNHTNDMTGIRLYSWLVKNNYPDGFQVLCMNCNHAKGHFEICPHQKLMKLKTYINLPTYFDLMLPKKSMYQNFN